MAYGEHDSETGDERIFFNGLEIASQRQSIKCTRQCFPLNRDSGLKKKHCSRFLESAFGSGRVTRDHLNPSFPACLLKLIDQN